MPPKFVSVETSEPGVLLIKKSRGTLSLENIMDTLREENDDGLFAIFFKPAAHDCYPGMDLDAQIPVEAHEITGLSYCPVCSKTLDEERGAIYDSGFQDGLAAARTAAKENA